MILIPSATYSNVTFMGMLAKVEEDSLSGSSVVLGSVISMLSSIEVVDWVVVVVVVGASVVVVVVVVVGSVVVVTVVVGADVEAAGEINKMPINY